MAPERRPTLRDVAALAGVSFKTVSRVINGEGGVSSDLTHKVQQAIVELNYRPDHRARLLRRSSASARAATLGFVQTDVSNPFFSSLLRGIEDVAVANGCVVLTGSTEGSTEREQLLIESFIGRRVDGLLVVSSQRASSAVREEVERGTPVVFLDHEPALGGVDFVRSDHYGGARLATRHLLDGGHTDIAYLGDDPELFSADLRLRGFVEAMADAGHQVPQHRVVTGSHTAAEWQLRAGRYLCEPPRPSAIFSAQNMVTMGTVRALHGLDLHRDIAQIGYDDVALADVVEPGITVVPQAPLELGRRAAELLLARIGGDTQPPVNQVIPTSLLVRGSGELRPAEQTTETVQTVPPVNPAPTVQPVQAAHDAGSRPLSDAER